MGSAVLGLTPPQSRPGYGRPLSPQLHEESGIVMRCRGIGIQQSNPLPVEKTGQVSLIEGGRTPC